MTITRYKQWHYEGHPCEIEPDPTGNYVSYNDHMAALAEAKGAGWVACSDRMPPVCRSTHMGNDASAEVVTVGPCGMCGMVYVEYVSNEGGLPGEWYVVDPDGSMDRTGEKHTPTHWLAVPPLPIPPGVGT